jgi:hypothetical protein
MIFITTRINYLKSLRDTPNKKGEKPAPLKYENKKPFKIAGFYDDTFHFETNYLKWQSYDLFM